jgi:hypothetical protein
MVKLTSYAQPTGGTWIVWLATGLDRLAARKFSCEIRLGGWGKTPLSINAIGGLRWCEASGATAAAQYHHPRHPVALERVWRNPGGIVKGIDNEHRAL